MAETMAELNKGVIDIFSSQETIVGTWADTGKTAYSKTFSGTIPANAVTSGNPYRLVDDNSIFIKEIIGGVVGAYPLPCYTNYGTNSTISAIFVDHYIELYTNVPAWANGANWHLTIVYTKS